MSYDERAADVAGVASHSLMAETIIVVSGLPRSGTSLVMQMLAAADVPVRLDGFRAADESNPRGYFEWERIKQLPRNPELIEECRGKAVKVISSLLPALPAGFIYKIVFLERQLADVVASQAKLIARLGTQGGKLANHSMIRALESHRSYVYAWLNMNKHAFIKVSFEELVIHPRCEAEKLGRYLDLGDGATETMAGVVDPALWNERARRDDPPETAPLIL